MSINDEKKEEKKLIDSIMASQKKEEMQNVNLSNMFSRAFSGLKRKQRHVLKRRFGLINGEKKTLQEIGDSYGVTRERIRQIEKSAIKRLSKEINFKYFSPITSMAVFELENAGGIMSEQALINKLISEGYGPIESNSLRLIFEVHPELILVKECDHKHESWCLDGCDIDDVLKIIFDAVEYLDKNNKVSKIEDLHSELSQKYNIDQEYLKSVLDLSKKVMVTQDDRYGLYDWTFINPKNIRDKIYYVLRKNKKPMHFMELTDVIAKEDFLHKKNITHQAVHNELIADPRYVLIGKGIYALTEWGYESGTVAEVIEKILLEKGHPLSKEEILTEVLKKRMVKKNTIVINLHNKDLFSKDNEGRFILKKR